MLGRFPDLFHLKSLPFLISEKWQKFLLNVLLELTVAGTVPDFNRIPFYA